MLLCLQLSLFLSLFCFTVLFGSAHVFWCIILHHNNNPFFQGCPLLLIKSELFMASLIFMVQKWIIPSNINNHNTIEGHNFFCHSLKNIAYFCLIVKFYSKAVLVMTDIILTWAASFISICIWDISSITLQQLHLTQLVCKNHHLRKIVDSICCHHWKQIWQLLQCHKMLVFFLM